DRLLAEREEDWRVEAYRESRDAGPDGELWEPFGFDLQQLTGERDVLGVVAAKDEFEPAVRDQRFTHIALLCCGDDRFAVLAHLTRQPSRHADFAEALAREDVVRLIEDEE